MASMTTKPTHNNSNNKQTNKQNKKELGEGALLSFTHSNFGSFHVNKTNFHMKSLRTRTRFETEAKDNSEIAYSHVITTVSKYHVANRIFEGHQLVNHHPLLLIMFKIPVINTQGRHVVNSLGTDILNA